LIVLSTVFIVVKNLALSICTLLRYQKGAS